MKNMTKEQQLVYRWSIAITRQCLRGVKHTGRHGGDRGYPKTPKFMAMATSDIAKRLLNLEPELYEAQQLGVKYAIKNP